MTAHPTLQHTVQQREHALDARREQSARATTFRALHVPGRPLVLYNVWDAGSARAVASAGAAAIATGSWSVAAAHGYEDAERLPLALVLDNGARIARAVDLPVSVDLESGYGDDPAAVGASVAAVLAAGAVGVNLEDGDPADGVLRSVDAQAARLAAARAAADRLGVRAFLNARTDVFLATARARHDDALVDAALARARAYAAAGADGLFVPGLVDGGLIARLTGASPLPVNVMAGDDTPDRATLAHLGVARVSHGPGPYRRLLRQLADDARAALA